MSTNYQYMALYVCQPMRAGEMGVGVVWVYNCV